MAVGGIVVGDEVAVAGGIVGDKVAVAGRLVAGSGVVFWLVSAPQASKITDNTVAMLKLRIDLLMLHLAVNVWVL